MRMKLTSAIAKRFENILSEIPAPIKLSRLAAGNSSAVPLRSLR